MAPTEFGDIGKIAKDLIDKDFPFEKTRFETKTTTRGGVEFTSILERKNSDGTIKGELKSKLKHSSNLVITDSYSTSNDLSLKVETPELVDGLTTDLEGTFNPSVGSRDVKLGAKFKSDYLTLTALTNTLSAQKVKVDAVVGYEGALVGGQVRYDIAKGSLSDYVLAVGYTEKNYSFALQSDKSSLITGTLSHVYSSDLALAARASLKPADKTFDIEIGAQYKVDRDSTLKLKVDSAGKVGLGYSQKIRPDLKVSFGLSVDTRKIDQNAHQLGYSFVFEPKDRKSVV